MIISRAKNDRIFVQNGERKMKRIAILGFGVVGSGVAQIIEENRGILTERLGEGLEIKYILDRRDLSGTAYADKATTDAEVIFRDAEVDAVVEMLGGSHPAYEYTRAALLAGKHVITSNKEVVSKYGAELLSLARERGVRYLFEASVGGGIPIIRPIMNDLISNNITEIRGILNGTTNYILTLMGESGADFDYALSDAQSKGYAEADPTADVEGLDAARKIAILSAMCFGKCPPADAIPRIGISAVVPEDIEAARALGYELRLIARAKMQDGRLYASVSPTFVPLSDPLAHVRGVYNGILAEADMLGPVFFSGQGAGKLPTASAVVADIADALEGKAVSPSPLLSWVNVSEAEIADDDELCYDYCILVRGRIDGIRYLDALGISVMLTHGKSISKCRHIADTTGFRYSIYPLI